MGEVKPKESKTIKEYKVKAFGHDIVVPVGSIVRNITACAPDDNYRFWADFGDYAKDETGLINSLLGHDLAHRGLDIPAEYCEPYSKEEE